ncbi:MAG: patatin-like phospholipase family protein [Rhodospirillales bacterium]|nr:patatin-like phospholipase family protein [Rhodospirillales bacterium]MCB9995774.1 patatin-like phospholipase family protein [Rhodospirillales bacterium]
MTKEKKQKNKAKDTGVPPQFRPQIGLALGSGMARGFAHIGVLKGLAKHNIHPTIVAGTSIGAVVGGCYLAGKLDEFEDWALSLTRRNMFKYMDFRARSASLIGGKRLESLMEEQFGNIMIEELPHPFIAIATDIVTGHEVWLRKGDFIGSIRASFALPGVFPPVHLNHRTLIDGALVNPVPVSACLALGSRLTIAVDLNADMIGKVVKPGQHYQTVAGFDIFNENDVPLEDQKLFKGTLTKRLFRRDADNPSLFGVMVSSLNIIQDRLTRSRLAGDPPDVHIKPRIGHIGLLEFEKAKELIKEGEASVDRAMPRIQAAVDILLPRAMREEMDNNS